MDAKLAEQRACNEGKREDGRFRPTTTEATSLIKGLYPAAGPAGSAGGGAGSGFLVDTGRRGCGVRGRGDPVFARSPSHAFCDMAAVVSVPTVSPHVYAKRTAVRRGRAAPWREAHGEGKRCEGYPDESPHKSDPVFWNWYGTEVSFRTPSPFTPQSAATPSPAGTRTPAFSAPAAAVPKAGSVPPAASPSPSAAVPQQ